MLTKITDNFFIDLDEIISFDYVVDRGGICVLKGKNDTIIVDTNQSEKLLLALKDYVNKKTHLIDVINKLGDSLTDEQKKQIGNLIMGFNNL